VFWFLGIPFGLAWLAGGAGLATGLAVGGAAAYYYTRPRYAYPAPVQYPYAYYPQPYYYQPWPAFGGFYGY
jgi:hypothetical protein